MMMIFFDIDGVIIENEQLHRAKNEQTAAAHGFHIQPSDWETLHGIGDHGIYHWIKTRQPYFALTEDMYISALQAYYIDYQHMLELRSGLLDAFMFLVARNQVAGFVTSGTRVQAQINLKILFDIVAAEHKIACRLEDFILVTAEDITHRKPAPDPYLRAIELLNKNLEKSDLPPLSAKDCIAIEDSVSGMQAAAAAGMQVVHWIPGDLNLIQKLMILAD